MMDYSANVRPVAPQPLLPNQLPMFFLFFCPQTPGGATSLLSFGRDATGSRYPKGETGLLVESSASLRDGGEQAQSTPAKGGLFLRVSASLWSVGFAGVGDLVLICSRRVIHCPRALRPSFFIRAGESRKQVPPPLPRWIGLIPCPSMGLPGGAEREGSFTSTTRTVVI
jgi:hypothetical protein